MQVDILGYYELLGLESRAGGKGVGTDDIKAAFRKAAQSMHPDKVLVMFLRLGFPYWPLWTYPPLRSLCLACLCLYHELISIMETNK